MQTESDRPQKHRVKAGQAPPGFLMEGTWRSVSNLRVCAVKPLHQTFSKDHTAHQSFSERHSEEAVG